MLMVGNTDTRERKLECESATVAGRRKRQVKGVVWGIPVGAGVGLSRVGFLGSER